ncbi:MAG: 2-succinyl-5-enolpyruvyl-6-hydroxy-3-cyclohexene-1-carboxylate synthase [Kiritimatiellae bacterium]|nr:2-succinyl-5-enolpyruvyl-6-hydroxy-3-cyclohexene-1-carboxylate synthase [Kiritimatiellia bacterium]
MVKHYTDEKHTQIVLALLKAHGIRRVVASPGTTNLPLVASMQSDKFFEMYSCVDERSAAYMACGLASETGEPVVISCTGATAAQNYISGLTEAYYRKLPVLAITSTQQFSRVGHLVAQVTDRSVFPLDTHQHSVTLPVVKDEDDAWDCEVKVNRAILALTRRGGGPVHINLPTTYNRSYETRDLPTVRKIERVECQNAFPDLPTGKIAVMVGSHRLMSEEETQALDAFCAAHDAVVFCDHTSGYRGRYRVLYALVAGQAINLDEHRPDLLIHIGDVTGDYYTMKLAGREVWRVSPDGEVRDLFHCLRYVFEMPESMFFQHYAASPTSSSNRYLTFCRESLASLRARIPELPLSNPWVASRLAHRIPEGAAIHFGILNSLRAWNFFELPPTVTSFSNVGGFGIDGCLSTVIGASFARPDRLYFAVVGDLATFYDINSLGNRHVGCNLRILLVNNGKGTEFRHYNHYASVHGEDADAFVAAAGHFGNQSKTLIRHYAEDLGFEYLQASTKEEFETSCDRFLTASVTERSMLFEVFTNSTDESCALEKMLGIERNQNENATKQLVKRAIGAKGVSLIKKVTQR